MLNDFSSVNMIKFFKIQHVTSATLAPSSKFILVEYTVNKPFSKWYSHRKLIGWSKRNVMPTAFYQN